MRPESKKYISFEEMYKNLKDDPVFLKSSADDIPNKISKIVNYIDTAKTSGDLFDAMCRLSFLFEGLDKKAIKEVFDVTSAHILIINSVFHNNALKEILPEIINNEGRKLDDDLELENMVFINTAMSLAFFPLVVSYDFLKNSDVENLRKNIIELLKDFPEKSGNEYRNIDYVDICLFLEKIVSDSRLHFNKAFPDKARFKIKLKGDFFFSIIKTSCSLAGVTFLSLTISSLLERGFKKQFKMLHESKRDPEVKYWSLSPALNWIFEIVNKLDAKIGRYYSHASKDISSFFDAFITKNESNLIFYLKEICSGFHFQEGKKVYDVFEQKIQNSIDIRKRIVNHSKLNFSAFTDGNSERKNEWTNKIFLISLKTISVLESLVSAVDKQWAVSVAKREMFDWLVETHEVLNKFYLEDDWEKIQECLNIENLEIEWKSSFFIETQKKQSDFPNEEAQNASVRKVFHIILRAILGMLNTSGGVILVGLIEKPDMVKNDHVRDNSIWKNNKAFFDIASEFKKFSTTLDNVRLQILDNLSSLTEATSDEFNNLIELEPITLRNEDKVISVIKINVSRNKNKLFFNKENRGEQKWISLIRRANGKTVNVDPTKYMKTSTE